MLKYGFRTEHQSMDVGLNNEVSLQNAYDEGLVSNIVFREWDFGEMIRS